MGPDQDQTGSAELVTPIGGSERDFPGWEGLLQLRFRNDADAWRLPPVGDWMPRSQGALRRRWRSIFRRRSTTS